jgi:hypothetical protein
MTRKTFGQIFPALRDARNERLEGYLSVRLAMLALDGGIATPLIVQQPFLKVGRVFGCHVMVRVAFGLHVAVEEEAIQALALATFVA